MEISKIVCGAMHSLVLTKDGQVFSWGNNDSHQLGREGFSKEPLKVILPMAVDLISAGETHSVAANSITGDIFIWGKFKGSENVVFQTKEIIHSSYYQIWKYGIRDIKSGMNHFLVYSGHQVYCFGDNSLGALGNSFKGDEKVSRVDPNNLTSLAQKRVSKIYTTYYSSFIVANIFSKKTQQIQTKLYGFGLNNHGQLGFKGEGNIVRIPTLIQTIDDEEIIDIRGGEHHTLFLMKSGKVYGAGRNDDGQLGEVEDTQVGTFKKLTHIEDVQEIYCSSHFNYALKGGQFYAWGFGADFVLANGQEDSLFVARPVNNEKVFVSFPQAMALGSNHVTYVSEAIYECRLTSLKKQRVKKIKDENEDSIEVVMQKKIN